MSSNSTRTIDLLKQWVINIYRGTDVTWDDIDEMVKKHGDLRLTKSWISFGDWCVENLEGISPVHVQDFYKLVGYPVSKSIINGESN